MSKFSSPKRFASVRGFMLVSVGNLAGMAALWYLGEHKFFQANDPGYEGTLMLLLIIGSAWAGIAVFLTLQAFIEFVRDFSVSAIGAALCLSISTLPISLVINHPGCTINPIGGLSGLHLSEYEVALAEYFVLTLLGGLALAWVARSARFTNFAIATSSWYILALFYIAQLPVKMWLG